MIRVGVIGAAGRMGAEVCRAVHDADGMTLVAAVDPNGDGRSLQDVAGVDVELQVASDLDALTAAEVDVAVDFTRPEAVADTVRWLLDHDVHAVVGTTGMAEDDLADVRERAERANANAFRAPTFAIGAVLLMQFAAQAAVHLPDVEIIELHHDRKADAPSGTALRTAELIADARDRVPPHVGGDEDHPGARGTRHRDVAVHAVRLPGLMAHQEVIFGGQGQTLTVRHDSLDRSSFMPGVVLAVRSVADLDPALVVGLEHLL